MESARDNFVEKVKIIRDIANLFYQKAKKKLGYGQALKDITENEAEDKTKEQQQDDEQFDTVPKVKFISKRRPTKEFKVIGNLNGVNANIIMAQLTPYTEMQAQVFYSFKSEIYRYASEIVDYSRVFTSPPGMLSSLEEIQAYIEECEQKQLDLENVLVYSHGYLPAIRTTEMQDDLTKAK